MNCEHFLFNGEVKYDVRVTASVLDSDGLCRDSYNKLFNAFPMLRITYEGLIECHNIVNLSARDRMPTFSARSKNVA